MIKEVKDRLSLRSKGVSKIESLDTNFPAYTYNHSGKLGVAIECEKDLIINEQFSNVYIKNIEFSREDEQTIIRNYIVLYIEDEKFINEFTVLCADFLDPGENGLNRKLVLNHPHKWWAQWCELLGNSVRTKKPYSLVAEMYSYLKLLKGDNTVVWKGPEYSSHDLEGELFHYEVKSTLSKYKNVVEISSQFQLDQKKPLKLIFVKMEQSGEGESIDSLLELILLEKNNELDRYTLNKMLAEQGYEFGTMARSLKYNILEVKVYDIDDNFPKILTENYDSTRILKVTYSVDLTGINFEDL